MKAKIIFTYRPLKFSLISFVNMITRIVQGYPRDHVAILFDGDIYESSFGPGVQQLPYDEWVSDRIGTDVTEYTVDVEDLDFKVFDNLEFTKYDTRAAIFHLFGFEERLERRANKAINCSELVALMLGMEKAWKATPEDVEKYLRSRFYKSVNKTL